MLSSAERAQLAARLRRGRVPQPVGIPPRQPGGAVPVSFGQEQLWFIDQFAPGSVTYNIVGGLRMRGPLDVAALGRAVDALLGRHEALRTRIVTDGESRPVQAVDPPASGGLAVVECAGEDELWRLAAAEAARPFVLADGPLFRCRLGKLADDEHVLIVVVHHIVFDGWSFGVLQRELAALYEAEHTGQPAALPPMPIQFGDYASWERERLRGASLDKLVEYWREALSGAPTLALRTDRPRPVMERHVGAVERIDIDLDLLANLRTLSRAHDTTLFVTLLAALQVLLHRYTGQDDVIVGTVSANRSRPELAPLIGFLVNALPIRTVLKGDPTFAEVIEQVRDTTVAAYAHQELPFAKLVDALHLDRDTSRAPVFQVSFTQAEVGGDPVTGAGVEFTFSDGNLRPGTAKFDLALFAGTSDREFHVLAEYATDLFDAATIQRLLRHYANLLRAAAADPTQAVSRLSLLDKDELHRELVEWNDTAAVHRESCLHEAFERQAARTPEALAATFGAESIGYGELNAHANQLARRLRQLGVGPEILVGICMQPSLRRLIALLAVLKAGSGYVPLDPDLPAERLAFMMDDANCLVVTVDSDSRAAVAGTSETLLDVTADWPSALPVENVDSEVTPANVAYVIYTSGSTGQPKGVVVEHRNIDKLIAGALSIWKLAPAEPVLQFASLTFDVSVLDMFVALYSGATVVLTGRETRMSPPRLAELMRRRRVSWACLPPAVAGLLDGDFPALRTLVTAGEELPPEVLRKWLRPGLRLYNGYGPTETAVLATVAELDGTIVPPPIGRPAPNYRAYVLDARLNAVPMGVAGELHVGGPGVARGYLNRPELTAERFIDDPFRPGERLYKTGDLVCRLPDGQLQFLGRIDGQVKIHGQRIELGEVEAALVSHVAVAQAVVTVSAARQLIGYVRLESGTTTAPAELREHTARWLPSYMVPAQVVVVDEFPLNSSGKIDKRALPSPEPEPLTTFAAPRTLTEAGLTDIYADLLGRKGIGADDGFFDLGGNSLQVMQLVSRIRTGLGVDLGVSAVFLAPSPRQLARQVEAQRAAARPQTRSPLVPLSDRLDDPQLFLVHAIGGTVFHYLPLARELADGFAVCGIEAPGLHDTSGALATMSELADRHVDEIRARQPHGPYRIAGWSLGGLLAFEIARRLEASGAEVAVLALLDAPHPFGTEPLASEMDGAFVADAARTLGWPPDELPGADVDQVSWLCDQLGGGDEVRAQVTRRFAVFEAHRSALVGYTPAGTVATNVLLVGAKTSPNAAHQSRWLARFAGSVSTVTIDADHYTLLQPPRVDEVATALLKTLGDG
jgi:amino acid adenylation domain-containing protein